eukprot:TRINITY_DN60273_c0_g1_i1.p1 TRINITY_DN60273_c0_g1~~TRINITY_DN60273_c0_g1_i1.p1  ORF type:complete len:153 (+),score=13.18 TRINITY_DN60273_c0_g1_i1:75-533(+)
MRSLLYTTDSIACPPHQRALFTLNINGHLDRWQILWLIIAGLVIGITALVGGTLDRSNGIRKGKGRSDHMALAQVLTCRAKRGVHENLASCSTNLGKCNVNVGSYRFNIHIAATKKVLANLTPKTAAKIVPAVGMAMQLPAKSRQNPGVRIL